MTTPAKWRAIAYIAAIFLVGGVTGAVIAVSVTKRQMSFSPRSHDIAVHMHDRLKLSLGLTDDQSQKIDPVVQKAGDEMQKIHTETMEQVRKVMDTSYAQIAAILTPDQKKKLEEIEKQRDEFPPRHRFHDHPPSDSTGSPPPGPSPNVSAASPSPAQQ